MVGEKRRCGPVEFRTLKYFLTVAPVSSTHLSIDEDSDGIAVEDLALENTDQIYRNALSGSIDGVKFDDVSIANATIIDGRSRADPVSYTHLDVYKRQHGYRVTRSVCCHPYHLWPYYTRVNHRCKESRSPLGFGSVNHYNNFNRFTNSLNHYMERSCVHEQRSKTVHHLRDAGAGGGTDRGKARCV